MLKNYLSENVIKQPIYDSKSNQSITSLSQIYNGSTVVYLDESIGHLQTKEIENIDKYYDEQYKFFDQSEENDVLYSVINGKEVFRQEHQINTLMNKIEFQKGMKILDYGCAKGTVMKHLAQLNKEVSVNLYDVSRRYEHLWAKFIPNTQYCSYELKQEWHKNFDVITSFFAFEHTPDPLKELTSIKRLLKNDGLVYLIVPNVFDNVGDFVVVDHVHHYSEVSLRYMFAKAGFEVVNVDDKAHYAAFVVIAKNSSCNQLDYTPTSNQLDIVNKNFKNIANYWQSIQDKIQTFEVANLQRGSAIYGAGVYGNFIATRLKNLEKMDCFIDQNPLLHGNNFLNRKVLSPKDLPEHIDTVYVGLNPKIAKDVINNISDWKQRDLQFLFL